MEEYHNTTDLTGGELETAIMLAKGQDEILKKFFEEHPTKEVTSEELWINLFNTDEVPITSIRRSLNTLRDKLGVIENIPDENNGGKPKKKVGFVYGKKIFIWRAKRPEEEVQLELNL